MKSVAEKNLKFNKGIKVNFEGGNLTSDSGLILYKEFDEKIGLSETIKKNVSVKRSINILPVITRMTMPTSYPTNLC